MTDKKQIESILRVNGLGVSAPDEEIRSVLLSASFDDDEVKAALVVLRENIVTNETRVDGLHKVFRTDTHLQPNEISKLLGIDILVGDALSKDEKKRHLSHFDVVLLMLMSFLLAVAFILAYMYSHDIGIFHPASPLKINSISL